MKYWWNIDEILMIMEKKQSKWAKRKRWQGLRRWWKKISLKMGTGKQTITNHLSICGNGTRHFNILVCWLLGFPCWNPSVKSDAKLPKCDSKCHVRRVDFFGRLSSKCRDFRTQRIATVGVCLRVNRKIQKVIGSRKSWGKGIQACQSRARLKSPS